MARYFPGSLQDGSGHGSEPAACLRQDVFPQRLRKIATAFGLAGEEPM